jgi:hypothetical protein
MFNGCQSITIKFCTHENDPGINMRSSTLREARIIAKQQAKIADDTRFLVVTIGDVTTVESFNP